MLTPLIDNYLAIRRAVGFQLLTQEGHLRHYARFASERGDTHVRAQTALDWAAEAPSPHQRGHRLDIVRIFARHVHIEDARHEIPPPGVFSSKRSPYRPFIYTLEQIHQLLERASKLEPVGSLRPWTYCTLFSLLAVTGMRISEAIALRFDDITEDGLVIRAAKFQKYAGLRAMPMRAAVNCADPANSWTRAKCNSHLPRHSYRPSRNVRRPVSTRFASVGLDLRQNFLFKFQTRIQVHLSCLG